MTGFSHDIAGGQGNLIATSVQSPDFVTGVSGWQIRKDGSVEFNSGTFRGTVTGGAFDGTDFIINSVGEFFYSGTPAAGNLIASNSNQSGVDQFGNQYIHGDVSYNPGASTVQAVQNYNAQTVYWVATVSITSTSPVWWQQVGAIQAVVALEASGVGGTQPGLHLSCTNSLPVWTDTQLIVSGGVVAAAPGSSPLVAETWHALSLVSGWSSVAGFHTPSYRINALGNVELTGRITSTSKASAAAIATLPSGYHSGSVTLDAPCGLVSSANALPATTTPRLFLDNTGALSIQGISPTAGSVTMALDCTLMLSAG